MPTGNYTLFLRNPATAHTIVETEEGKSAPARKVKGLTFATVRSETTSIDPDVLPIIESSPLITANPVVPHTDAVPQSISTENTTTAPSTVNGNPSVGAMWMHWAWIFVPLASLIIWTVIKDKEEHANAHGKHVLNAFLTFMIHSVIFGVAVAITVVVKAIIHETFSSYNDDFIPVLLSGAISLTILAGILFVSIRAVISAIKIGIAAGNGEIIPYKWAICFCKTDFNESDSLTNSYESKSREFVILGLFFFGAIFANGIYYVYSQQKSSAISKELDDFVAKQRNDTEEFMAEQGRRTDEVIARNREIRAGVRDEATKNRFLEEIKTAETIPVFEGSSIKQLINAGSIFAPFTDNDRDSLLPGSSVVGYTIRLRELPEPYTSGRSSFFYTSSTGMPVILVDGTDLIFIEHGMFRLIDAILRQRVYEHIDVRVMDARAKDDVLRYISDITRNSGLNSTERIMRALIERNIVYRFISNFPVEEHEIFDIFLQANFTKAPLFGIVDWTTEPSAVRITSGYRLGDFRSSDFVIGFCSSGSSSSSFFVRTMLEINVGIGARRNRFEIYTDGEFSLAPQSFRIINDNGVVFDSGRIRFVESSGRFARLATLNLSNEDRDTILAAISANGKCEFVFYESDDRTRTAEMDTEHRERFSRMQALIHVIEPRLNR